MSKDAGDGWAPVQSLEDQSLQMAAADSHNNKVGQQLVSSIFMTAPPHSRVRRWPLVFVVTFTMALGLCYVLASFSASQTRIMSCYRPVVDILYNVATDNSTTRTSDLSRHHKDLDQLQGLAVHPEEPNVLYIGYTYGVRKVQLEEENGVWKAVNILAERTYNLSLDFPSIETSAGKSRPVAHFGGISIARNKDTESSLELLLAAHTEIDENGAGGGGVVVGVETDALEFTGIVTAHNPMASNDWVAVDHANGIGYAGAFFNVTEALRFRINEGNYEDSSPLQFGGNGLPENGINYIQSATILGSTLLLATNDYQGSLYHIDVNTGRVRARQSLLLGNELDGLELMNGNQLLVGFNREHSHEQVKLQSIILMESVDKRVEVDATVACGGSYVRFPDN